MPNALTDLFEELTNSLRNDREMLNNLDNDYDGDAGDNMVDNFATITRALRESEGSVSTVDQALRYASDALQKDGKGAMAPLYAQGLVQAASNLEGKSSFSLNDLQGLLGGLLSGAQQAGGGQKSGGMFDSLLPGITTFLQSRKNGASVLEALMQGFFASQRGAYGTSRQNTGFGSFTDRDTGGRVDPGAAAGSSLLGGLLGSLLSGGLGAGRGEQPRSPGLGELFGGGGLGELLGGAGGLGGLGELFGGGGGGSSRGSTGEPRAKIGPSETI